MIEKNILLTNQFPAIRPNWDSYKFHWTTVAPEFNLNIKQHIDLLQYQSTS